jgi:hypothetical protein
MKEPGKSLSPGVVRAGRPGAPGIARGRARLLACLLVPLATLGEPAERILDSSEIQAQFADVRDHAVLLDAPGTTAVNEWHADGRFVSEWRNANRVGRVSGRWYVSGGLRCVLLDDAAGLETPRCGRITRRGDVYVSYNPDGTRHGEHSLRPLKALSTPLR